MDINKFVEQTFAKTARITLKDEVHCIITGLHPEHAKVFYDEYSYYVDGYFFRPKYKLGVWDGKSHLFSMEGRTYNYFLSELIPKIKAFGYKIETNDKRVGKFTEPDQINEDHFSHIADPKTDEPIKIRDYQLAAINLCLDNGAGIVLAGTGAGKAQPLDSLVLTPNGLSLIHI